VAETLGCVVKDADDVKRLKPASWPRAASPASFAAQS